MLARLKEALSYDPETGLFAWLVKSGRANPGSLAGFIKNGYRYIRFEGRAYRANRLAWFYMTGEWPPGEVDHEDTVKLNDRWSNLRVASSLQNKANSKVRKDSQVGTKGVSVQRSGRYRAKIKVSGQIVALGTFDTVEQASAAYRNAAIQLHGDFARA